MTQQPPEDGSTQSFEYLGDAPEQAAEPRPRRGRRALVGVTVGALVVAGAAGAIAVAQFMSGGPQAASAAPAGTMAWLQVDLDPDGGQKVAAYRTLRKFPALEEQLGLTSQDDLRRWVFEGFTSEGDCDRVSFDDVDPWLGDALGVGAVPGSDEDGEPTVFLALEVKDQDKAAPGVRRLAGCLGEDEVGTAFVGDFMVVAETSALARSVADAAEESSLADDATYSDRTGDAGDDGIVTGYLAPAFGDFLSEQLGDLGGMFGEESSGSDSGPAVMAGRAGPRLAEGDEPSAAESSSTPGTAPSQSATELPSDFPTELLSDLPSDFPTGMPSGMPDGLDGLEGGLPMSPFMLGGPMGLLGLFGGGAGGFDQMAERLADFEGAAMHVRFADDALELEVASRGLDDEIAESGSVDLADLPAKTGLAFGIATGEDWADKLVEGLRSSDPEGFEEAMREASRETGLSMPEDLATLVGDSVVVSVDSSVDLAGLFESLFRSESPEPPPVGLRIAGDPDEIGPLLEKLADSAARSDGPAFVVERGEDAVAIGFDEDYVATLAQDGGLGGSTAFEQALGDEDSVGAAFVDFDAGGWLDRALEGSDAEERDNLEPLSGLGMSMTRDGDTVHGKVRLTTD